MLTAFHGRQQLVSQFYWQATERPYLAACFQATSSPRVKRLLLVEKHAYPHAERPILAIWQDTKVQSRVEAT